MAGDTVLPRGYVGDHVRLAYAVTVHKAQGLTVDRVILLGARRLESAISRGREMAIPDAEVLAYVEQHLDRLKRSMAAEPSATELFGSSDDDD